MSFCVSPLILYTRAAPRTPKTLKLKAGCLAYYLFDCPPEYCWYLGFRSFVFTLDVHLPKPPSKLSVLPEVSYCTRKHRLDLVPVLFRKANKPAAPPCRLHLHLHRSPRVMVARSQSSLTPQTQRYRRQKLFQTSKVQAQDPCAFPTSSWVPL